MVGIGGGVPSVRHDIRLGDIVVSASRGGKGAVFQYDRGRLIQDQAFVPAGLSKEPPMVLQRAMNRLNDNYYSEGHRLEKTIKDILEKNSRLREQYKRPDPSRDRLYNGSYTHPQDDTRRCDKFCDTSRLIARYERTLDEDNPAIHYGLIASANQLMRDALARDRIAAENDVLCFETEAAGVMNHFPNLVIRGICDYSDTHIHTGWHGYAAMAAAAYVKDLLYQVPSSNNEPEKSIRDGPSGQSKETSVVLTPLEPRHRRNIEIAIICALPREADAVKALFDNCWDDTGQKYGKTKGDPNAYTIGAIGCHNVVLAHLPDMGEINAASVAASCKSSFENIKLALVVGICGGVPFPKGHEGIMLGDVVVSHGIIQYDFGKQYPEGFQMKDGPLDILPRPSMEIQSLLAKLKTHDDRKGSTREDV
ncbi:hypothetical protein GJ744_005766 [Endocarpon pusillum]|uniref:Nucleoside phosphorylase domain-containing protein n=1 Tax=Endocarpon pusillum TaxID=364733 RepID=A0A8H7APZ1_9EURO|nr:hypothetical protein GJ744_005766 [Endocarpon pusillum]